MARNRSPNYPSMSLRAAVDKVRDIQKAEGQNAIARESVARIMGFSGINGASATAISALSKYGLLQAVGDGEARVSDLAVSILYPETEQERRQAIAEAATRPVLFKAISEKWPERPPGDDSLRSLLVKSGFAQGALDTVIQIYRDTIDFADLGKGSYHPAASAKEEPAMQTDLGKGRNTPPPPPPPSSSMGDKPFSVAFDGTVLSGTLNVKTVRDFDRLMKVLTAQRGVLEAMEDDDHADQIDPLS